MWCSILVHLNLKPGDILLKANWKELRVIDWLIDLQLGLRPYGPDAPGPLLMGPLCPISIYGNPIALLKFRMAPRLMLLMSCGSKKKEPRYTCLSEAKASHSQRMWAEVSSSALHLLQSGLSDSPIRWRCLLRVLCPVRRPVTALDSVLLKDRRLALTPRQGPEINSRACLKVSPRPLNRGLGDTQRQAWELILGPCLGAKARFLSLNRTLSRAVASLLTGRNTLRRSSPNGAVRQSTPKSVGY